MKHHTQNPLEDMSLPPATIDFESRSAANIKKTGSWKYSLDPSTEVLCLAFRMPYWDAGRTELWHPAFPEIDLPEAESEFLPELFEWINEGNLIEAHNAWFERGIWTNVCVPRLGWPAIGSSQWRCSAAKAASMSLPRKLELAALALKLPQQKDLEGHKAMLKLSKPRKARKKEIEVWKKTNGRKPMPRLWHLSLDMLTTLFAYCRQDVLTEESLSHSLPDLLPQEVEMYLLDQTINQRGFQLDPEAVGSALYMIAAEVKLLNAELSKLTKGVVTKATQRARMIKWFATVGLTMFDTQKATLDAMLSPDSKDLAHISSTARRGLELVRTLGRSSTAKYETMKHWACADWRVRGGLLYHGATTGRWSGAGVQPHNFVKGNVKDMEAAWKILKTRNRENIIAHQFDGKNPVGEIMKPLSEALRGAIIASLGKNLYVADFVGIEARVLLWLADDQEGLDIFRKGLDIYMDMASTIYGYPVIDKDKQKDERALGKVAILGLGYQMGASKFVDTAFDMGKLTIDQDLAQQTVDAYRAKYWRVKEMWYAQEAAAIRAVGAKGQSIKEGMMSWKVDGKFLLCTLPSGRRLSYPFPQIKAKKTPWGELKPALTFMGMSPITHKWERLHTYGGMIVENQTQGVARDFLASAMQRVEKTGIYELVLSVHDEAICEAHPAWASVEEFNRLMERVPFWGKGCPISAESWSGLRYCKK